MDYGGKSAEIRNGRTFARHVPIKCFAEFAGAVAFYRRIGGIWHCRFYCRLCDCEPKEHATGGLMQIDYNIFPVVNASLNGVSAVLIATGRVLIRNHQVKLHKLCMIAAVFPSPLFLTCYLFYPFPVRSVHFPGPSSVRPLVFPVLFFPPPPPTTVPPNL